MVKITIQKIFPEKVYSEQAALHLIHTCLFWQSCPFEKSKDSFIILTLV